MKEIKGFIFDLDGVIVDTAKYHFIAWQAVARELGIDFTEEDNEALKGVSRKKAFDLLLSFGGLTLTEDEKEPFLERKNRHYLALVDQMGTGEILPGVLPFLEVLQRKNYKTALGSASKNARRVLDRLNLTPFFQVIIDGNRVKKAKPDPEVFLLGAGELGLPPENCLVFEDARAGIAAAKAAGMIAVGIGKRDQLSQADLVIPGFYQESPEALLQRLLRL
ncbi:beta-phosphoglucomutase [Isachenkonia alkalipeptolytica]|uniref:Beta-phosphoglucomutase n=1 Tax=Isachenkonia alkalipeptolytica TaxID=2565777 RepID=A0AA44BDS7_9CLOT|nr:beta-phosphoglucomutase [Isachenkonia alkalipeptolytica]NBG88243.1 beta-phosphoglucomutase [Isachenkonia alkalipeptolytica]